MQKENQSSTLVLKMGAALLLLVFLLTLKASSQHKLNYHFVDKDTTFTWQSLGLKSQFTDAAACSSYINNLTVFLFSKGYPSASVDSVYTNAKQTFIYLFLGYNYKGFKLNVDIVSSQINQIPDFNNSSSNSLISFEEVKKKQRALVDFYASNGYPFATVTIKNVQINDSILTGSFNINKGPLYHIDSIRQYGKLKINKSFLYHYFSINKGSIYQDYKIKRVDKKLEDLDYLKVIQKPDVTMLGTGAILNLYLDPKRSSQFDVLVGLVPPPDANTKAHLTGDINLNLKNALKSGESILLNWQQLQKGSPRVNFGFVQPYFLNAPFGIDFNFNLLKKDSDYIKLFGELGIRYQVSTDQFLKVFVNEQRSYLLQGGFDSNQVRISKVLPRNIDYSSTSFGVDYKFINTNYNLNPRKGSDVNLIASAGLKKITSNNDITNLMDPSNPTFNYRSLYDSLGNNNYEFLVKLSGTHYFPSGKRSVLKIAINTAMVGSDHLFRNELFLIGGYRLLRGFDEESIYANKYVVFTTEYRYLTGQNSFLYIFNDLGLTQTKFQKVNISNNFISAGIGVSFETKAGLLNLTYALGKRNDVPFSLSEASKIHFGFINFF